MPRKHLTLDAKHVIKIFNEWQHGLLDQAVAEGEVKGRAQGETMGELKGMRESLVACYRARFGDFPAEFHAVVEATTDAATLQRWVTLCAAATADDIIAAFSAASR